MTTIAASLMKLCWLYAWASYSMTSFASRPFPVSCALMLFIMAHLAASLTARSNWRLISIAFFHAGLFALGGLITLYAAWPSSYSLFDPPWFFALFAALSGVQAWTDIVMALAWILLFWIGGATQAKRRSGIWQHMGFDVGLSAFFGLYLVKLLVEVRIGPRPDDHLSFLLLFPFLFFSLLAIGTARLKGTGMRRFFGGFRGAGMVTGFAVLVISVSTGIVLVWMSGMQAAAGATYRALRYGTLAVAPMIEGLLRLFFFGRSVRPEPPSSSAKSGLDHALYGGHDSWWGRLMDTVFGWGMAALLLLLSALVFGLLLTMAIKWLLSRRRPHVAGREAPSALWQFLLRLVHALRFVKKRIDRLRRSLGSSADLYDLLLRWARRSGLNPTIAETPLEFSLRLSSRFPRLRPEVRSIVDAYNREVYGGLSLSVDGLSDLRLSMRRLQSPAHWPTRLKVRFGS